MADEDGTGFIVKYEDITEPTDWIEKAGKCKVTYPNGNTFEGIYDDEKKKQGEGVYTWSQPPPEEGEEEEAASTAPVSIYSGNFKSGKKHGTGMLTYPDGARYSGSWTKNQKDGQGSYFYPNGDMYEGQWSKDIKHGEGCYTVAADQSKFIGTWDKGAFVSGKWAYADGGCYEGTFKNGAPSGEGKYVMAGGSSVEGGYSEKTEDVEGEDVTSVVWAAGKVTMVAA